MTSILTPGADIFTFSTSRGLDTITDYAVAEGDTLNVHAYNNAAHTITQVGADTQIAFGANIITVLNTQANDGVVLGPSLSVDNGPGCDIVLLKRLVFLLLVAVNDREKCRALSYRKPDLKHDDFRFLHG